MARAITEPAAPIDSFNPPDGSPVFLHDQATRDHYRALAAKADQRRQVGAAAPAQPGLPGLPAPGVARHFQAKELAELRLKVQGHESWLTTSAVGAGGIPLTTLPGYGTQRQAVIDELDRLRESISRLEQMDDQAVRVWAGARGVQ